MFVALLVMTATWASAQQMLESSEWCATGKKQLHVLNAADQRSDSIDILSTGIDLNILSAPAVTAHCAIEFSIKAAQVPGIRLDLEGLTVDSVRYDGQSVGFTYASPSLSIAFPTVLPAGAHKTLDIFYHGTPVQDASGWGGIYNQTGGYFYNLGVGFAADPHSYGRAWFPCFDNFVERCTFTINVTSNASKPAYCNGALVAQQPVGTSGVRRSWQLDHPIPSYLACFTTGPFTSFKRTMQGANGPVPVEIAAAPADTTNVAGTFQHLQQALTAFEYWYGPYRWNKIGYSLVPFNSGAMEHATNISIGKAYINGSLTYETLWAHEFSHHWWGDLATCLTAGDMWLNEGWASYSERLFTEWLYGKKAYTSAVGSDFLDVLQTAHITDGSYLAISGVPQDYTYGKTVYHKGAAVIHDLRTYLGDTLFRQGIRAALEQTQYDNWSTAQFKDKLTAATGKDLTHFFDDWVLSPGFTDFSVDSFQVNPVGSQFQVTVFVRQKLRGAPHYYQDVPLECAFVSDNWHREYRTGLVGGSLTTLQFTVPFPPKWVWLNTNLLITQARADREQIAKAPAQLPFAPAKMDVKVISLTDSALIRVEHHFSMPDTAGTANPHGYRITNRYWAVDGAFPAGFDASANVFYDGRGEQDQLDAELFAQTGPSEDSVRLLYRPGVGHAWQEYPTYAKNTLGSANDRNGLIRIDHLLPGQYTFGKGASTLFASEAPAALFTTTVFPNPANHRLRVQAEADFQALNLYSIDGQQVKSWKIPVTRSTEIELSGIRAGHYWIVATGPAGAGICPVVIQQ